jgi:hypothetical protein
MYFVYGTDANYNASTNTTASIKFTPAGAISASSLTVSGTVYFSSALTQNTSPTVVATFNSNDSKNGIGYATCSSLSVGYASSAGSVAWGNISGKPSTFTPSSHTHDYIASMGNYTFDSSTLPNTFPLGVSCGFVDSNSGFGSYGGVITHRAYTGGGGSLQLYSPYSSTYGGTHLKARFGNYSVSSGNSWTDLKELAWVEDLTWNNISGKPSTFTPTSHSHDYLPLSGGTITGNINFASNTSTTSPTGQRIVINGV